MEQRPDRIQVLTGHLGHPEIIKSDALSAQVTLASQPMLQGQVRHYFDCACI